MISDIGLLDESVPRSVGLPISMFITCLLKACASGCNERLDYVYVNMTEASLNGRLNERTNEQTNERIFHLQDM